MAGMAESDGAVAFYRYKKYQLFTNILFFCFHPLPRIACGISLVISMMNVGTQEMVNTLRFKINLECLE
jgi:hypothetical protein